MTIINSTTKIPKAIGTAQKMIEEAEGYAIERTNNALGDVARFNSIYKEYVKARTVTRTRMYLETIKKVFPTIREIVVLDQGKKGVIPLLNLGDTLGGTKNIRSTGK